MRGVGGIIKAKIVYIGLEGKRNRRLDHLIYVLVHDVVPYFRAKHHWQEFGFEGLDLEMKRRAEINAAAPSFPVDNITDYEIDDEPGQFSVQSQSNPQITYHVDIEAYTCNCPSYSLIFYCKHLAAVQLHFYEELDLLPIASLFTSTGNSPASLTPSSHTTDSVLAEPNADLAILAGIPAKLQTLAVRTRLSPLHHMSDPLRQLDNLLDLLLAGSVQPQVLPKRKKVAPNQHSWSETASVMGANTKTKRKRAHTDPYSGGQGSGKKAKTDARAPLVAKGARYVYFLCLLSSFTDCFTITYFN